MYKLLLVEDEEISRQVITRILSEDFSDSLEIFETGSGTKGLEIAVREQVQIVIMDINLGSTNGIHISADILRENPSARILILTAYDSFAYAQSALRLGVSDFLLKPVNRQELCRAVKTQMEDIRCSMERVRELALTQKNLEEMRRSLRDTLPCWLLSQETPATEISDVLELLGIRFQQAFVLLMEIKARNIYLDFQGKLRLRDRIREFLKEEYPPVRLCFYETGDCYLAGIVFEELEENRDAYDSRIRRMEFTYDMQNRIMKKFYVDIKIGISQETDRPDTLSRLYTQARCALSQGIAEVNDYQDVISQEIAGGYPQEEGERLVQALFSTQQGKLDHSYGEFIRCLAFDGDRHRYREGILRLLMEIYQELLTRFSSKESQISQFMFSEAMDIFQKDDFYLLEEEIRKLLHRVREMIEHKTSGQSHYLTDKIKKYIEENYRSKITLEDTSRKFSISSYYLSKLFKKETGFNLIEYVNLLRLKEAQHLLKETALTISVISDQVGFSDANYFTKLFRKTTGMKPTEYRNADL